MSEDTFGTAVKLQCGHWVYVKDTKLIDGCVRCRNTEMRDSNDRHEPRKR